MQVGRHCPEPRVTLDRNVCDHRNRLTPQRDQRRLGDRTQLACADLRENGWRHRAAAAVVHAGCRTIPQRGDVLLGRGQVTRGYPAGSAGDR